MVSSQRWKARTKSGHGVNRFTNDRCSVTNALNRDSQTTGEQPRLIANVQVRHRQLNAETSASSTSLLDLFVSSVLITVGTELFQFDPCCGVTPVLFGGVTRDTRRTLIQVRSTFGTFQRNDNSYALIFSHDGINSAEDKFSTQSSIISQV